MYKYVKRVLDFTISLCFILILFPLEVLLAILIKLEDGEKVLFIQKRTGYKGKLINVYKFRTMKINNDVLEFSKEDEYTKIGKIIRKLSLDELPQLINILKGDMSFIGPRPWITEYYERFNEHQKKRCDVLPGLSGLAQINGRNNITIFEKIAYDICYVDRISLALDIKICLCTILSVIKKDGAVSSKFTIKEELEQLEGQEKQLISSENKYTVLMSIYKNDKPEWIEQAILSMLNQTMKPDEVLILVDGYISKEIKSVLKLFEKESIINIKYFEENRGLGPVLRDGVIIAKNELIARMDADDISVPERCELQLKNFQEKPYLDLVGGYFYEFMNDLDEKVSLKKYPITNEEIKKFAKRRNPFAHPSVMFRKSSVIRCGNYRDVNLCEDYDLWSRMLLNKCNCENINKPILNMRVDENFYDRRGGFDYMKKIINFKYTLLQRHFCSIFDFCYSALASILVCVIPNRLRERVYLKYLRDNDQEVKLIQEGKLVKEAKLMKDGKLVKEGKLISEKSLMYNKYI